MRALLPKLLRFFDKEGVEYNLTEQWREIYNEIRVQQEDFAKRKGELGAFRAGVVLPSYKEFVEFLGKNLKRRLKSHQQKSAFHEGVDCVLHGNKSRAPY